MRNYKNLVSGRFEFGKGANTVIVEVRFYCDKLLEKDMLEIISRITK